MLPNLFHFAFADGTPPFTLVGKLGLEAFTLQLQVGPLKSSRWGKGRRFFRARRLKRYSWSQSHESRVYWFKLLTRIEVFEIIPCSQVCWWTSRRPLTQQACQRLVPVISLSEIFFRHWTIKQLTFRMKESRFYLTVATQLVKWFLTQARRFLENARSLGLHAKWKLQ